MNRPRLVSTIYRQGPSPEPTGQVADDRNRAACAALWHQRGKVVLDPEDIADEWLRQAIYSLAERLYGRRNGRRAG